MMAQKRDSGFDPKSLAVLVKLRCNKQLDAYSITSSASELVRHLLGRQRLRQ